MRTVLGVILWLALQGAAPARAADCLDEVKDVLHKATRPTLTTQEQVDALVKIRSYEPEALSETQKKWIYQQFKDLQGRLDAGTEKEVVLTKKRGVNAWTGDTEVDRGLLDSTLKLYEKDGTLDLVGYLEDWLYFRNLRAPDALIEKVAAAGDAEALERAMTKDLGWTAEVSADGKIVTYSNAGFSRPIRLLRGEPLTAATQEAVVKALRTGGLYVEPDAIPVIAASSTNLNYLRDLLSDELDWTTKGDGPVGTVTFIDPANPTTRITVAEPQIGSTLTRFTEADLEGIASAIRSHTSFADAEAQELMAKFEKLPVEKFEEMASRPGLVSENDFRSLETTLGWKSEENSFAKTITFFDPAHPDTRITFPSTEFGGQLPAFTDEEKKGFLAAVRSHTGYITPGARQRLEAFAKAPVELLEQLLRTDTANLNDLNTLFKSKLGWIARSDRRGVVTFIDPAHPATRVTVLDPGFGFLKPYDQAEKQGFLDAARGGTSYSTPDAKAKLAAAGSVDTGVVDRLLDGRARLHEAGRDDLAAELQNIETTLSPKRKRAIDLAHQAGVPGKDGKYSLADLKKKTQILKDAGFTKGEREALIRGRVAGGPQRGDFGVDQYGKTLQWTGEYWATTDVFDRAGAHPTYRVEDTYNQGRRTLPVEARPQRGEFRRDQYGKVKQWTGEYWATTDVFDRMGKAISPGLAK